MTTPRSFVPALCLALLALVMSAPLHAQRRTPDQVEQILRGLEQGMRALRQAGGQERLIGQLKEVAAHVRQQFAESRRDGGRERNTERGREGGEGEHREEREGREHREGRERERDGTRERGGGEREHATRQLRIKRWALEAIKESGNEKAAKLMHNAIRALEVGLEGRRDEEAAKIRESAPNLGAQTELLLWAGKLHEEKGRKDKAHAVTQLGQDFLSRYKEKRAKEKREEHPERRIARRHLNIKKSAWNAFREANKGKLAELGKRMWQAAAVRLEGNRGEEAQVALKREPSLGNQVELLQVAANLYKEWGHKERAGACAELAEVYAKKVRRNREREGERERPRERDRPRVPRHEHDNLQERLAKLEERMKRLERLLDRSGDRRRDKTTASGQVTQNGTGGPRSKSALSRAYCTV